MQTKLVIIHQNGQIYRKGPDSEAILESTLRGFFGGDSTEGSPDCHFRCVEGIKALQVS